MTKKTNRTAVKADHEGMASWKMVDRSRFRGAVHDRVKVQRLKKQVHGRRRCLPSAKVTSYDRDERRQRGATTAANEAGKEQATAGSRSRGQVSERGRQR
jgi:hypothetical protein